MQNITRRKALKAGGAALAVSGATATLGFPAMAKGDDSELFAMNRKLEAAKAKENEACHAYGEAEIAAWKEAGPKPQDPVNFYNPATLQWERLITAASKSQYEDYRRAYIAYAEREKRANAKHGVEAADRRHQKAMARRSAIEAELLMMPAATINGMLIKARIANEWLDDDGQPEHTAVIGLLADLERLAGGVS